ncbi:hypothetical protein ACLOJK_013966 [Asimina triloba]
METSRNLVSRGGVDCLYLAVTRLVFKACCSFSATEKENETTLTFGRNSKGQGVGVDRAIRRHVSKTKVQVVDDGEENTSEKRSACHQLKVWTVVDGGWSPPSASRTRVAWALARVRCQTFIRLASCGLRALTGTSSINRHLGGGFWIVDSGWHGIHLNGGPRLFFPLSLGVFLQIQADGHGGQNQKLV